MTVALLGALCSVVCLVPHEIQEITGIELPRGSANSIYISPDGAWWIGARHGALYSSAVGGRAWREVDVPTVKGDGPMRTGGDKIKDIQFFDGLSGLFIVFSPTNPSTLFRSVDGGRHWDRQLLPTKSTTTSMSVLGNGTAFVGTTGGELLTSTDYGATWALLDIPLGGARVSSLYFASPLVGVVASPGAGLAYTEDGGKTWTAIASPASNGEADNVSEAATDDGSNQIGRIRVSGSLIVALQRLQSEEYELFLRDRADAAHGSWRKLELEKGSHPRDCELSGDRLIVMASNGELLEVSPTGEILKRSKLQLKRLPRAGLSGGLSVTDGGRSVIVFDGFSQFETVRG